MNVLKYKINVDGRGEVRRVISMLLAAGYLLSKEFRLSKLGDEEYNTIENFKTHERDFHYITYNNNGCFCKKVFEMGYDTDCHCEVSIEEFLKLDLINK